MNRIRSVLALMAGPLIATITSLSLSACEWPESPPPQASEVITDLAWSYCARSRCHLEEPERTAKTQHCADVLARSLCANRWRCDEPYPAELLDQADECLGDLAECAVPGEENPPSRLGLSDL